MNHKIMVKKEDYTDIINDARPFLIRKNNRGFETGDILEMWEYSDLEQNLTGQHNVRLITHTTTDKIKEGYICMGLQPISIDCARALDAQT